MVRCPHRYLSHCQTRIPLDLVRQTTGPFHTKEKAAAAQSRPLPRNPGVALQAGNIQSKPPALLPFQRFPGPKEVRGLQIHHQPLSPQQIHLRSKVSHVQPYLTGVHAPTSRMDNFHRPAGRLLSYSNPAITAQIPGFHARRAPILLQGTALRIKRSPIHLHPTTPLPSRRTPPVRHPSYRLHRRLDDLGKISDRRSQSFQHHPSVHTKTGVHRKYGKISSHPKHGRRMARSPLADRHRQVGPPLHQTDQPKNLHYRTVPQKHLLPQGMGKPTRSPKLRVSNSLPHSPPLTTSSETATAQQCLSQGHTGPNPRPLQTSPPPLAGPTPSRTNRSVSPSVQPSPPMDRRINNWVGGAHRNTQRVRDVDSTRATTAYKHPGGTGGTLNHPAAQHSQPPDPSIHRQCPSTICDQETLSKVSESSPRNILTHPHPEAERDQDPTLQNIHSPEQQSGQPQPFLHTPPRVGAPTRNIQLNHSTTGPPGDRSHGNSQEHQAPNLPISPSRPPSPRLQLPSLGLEPVATNLPIPTQVVHPDGHNQTPIVQTPRPHHPPVVSGGDMVPIYQEPGPPMVAPGPTRSHEEWTARLREVDRIQFLKESFASTLGDQVASRLVQAYRGSTNRQAESIWKTFQNWLPADVTSVTPRTVMEFLLALEARHLNPRTILNYRSQLRLPILQAFGLDLSSDLFSLLARSQFLKNPPDKKKVPQWCMDKVLATFSSEEFNMNTASPTNLLLKTIFLTALASGNRASELAATIREGLIISKDKAVLPTRPDFLFKNQNSQHPRPPDITFPALGRRHSLCPVNALKIYKAKTASLPHNGFLFVNPSSGRPLQAGRLSYWLAKAIKTGDPTATDPAGHDIRKFGFSIAHFRGVQPSEILQNGFWHSPNVFIRKYLISCKPSSTPVVAGRSK